jgi:hypothetical protein
MAAGAARGRNATASADNDGQGITHRVLSLSVAFKQRDFCKDGNPPEYRLDCMEGGGGRGG